MLIVTMTKNLKEYKPKIIAGLDKKQLLGIALGIPVTAVLAFLIPGDLIVRIMIAGVISSPFYLYGFLEIYGLDLLDILTLVTRSMLSGSVRLYKAETEILGVPHPEIREKKQEIKVKDRKKFMTIE